MLPTLYEALSSNMNWSKHPKSVLIMDEVDGLLLKGVTEAVEEEAEAVGTVFLYNFLQEDSHACDLAMKKKKETSFILLPEKKKVTSFILLPEKKVTSFIIYRYG
ncbi:uncharacterized protein LOC131232853 isoform X1 [Magnolia sinica]|uniref:uncharacterized protein LOC131232853 isoform X1 n=1 Tax=Magnolia sinica TaxID=86752 RepID=UPI00265891CB|nr:uncharacterized protein LOC131232853 isoform X1 [Magnolia sinica]